jgi:hypothetical protein
VGNKYYNNQTQNKRLHIPEITVAADINSNGMAEAFLFRSHAVFKITLMGDWLLEKVSVPLSGNAGYLV